MNLKTIKELSEHGDFTICDCGEEIIIDAICIEDLKKEAIKWLKEEINIKIKSILPIDENIFQQKVFEIIRNPEIKRWMNRFNITEGDLK